MLYLIATPIGNLGDMTYRAVETLKACDAVFCEDTRRSRILLDRYDVRKPLYPYHKFNEAESAPKVLALLRGGKEVALLSDAGTPLISDPGAVLTAACIAENLPFTALPGASACLPALALSGLDTRAFYFAGFLPDKNKERAAVLEALKPLAATLLFYVPPHDLQSVLAALYEHLGARRAAAVREITKLHEETLRFTLGDPYPPEPRGEYVLAVEGAPAPQNPLNALPLAEHLARYRAQGLPKKEAVKRTAKDRGIPKNEVYQIAIEE